MASTAGSRASWHVLAVHVFLACDIAFNSRLYRVVDHPMLQPALLGISAALILLYVLLALGRHQFRVALLGAAIAGLVWHQMDVASSLLRVDIQIGTFFQFIWSMGFVVFYVVARAGGADRLVRILVFYASAYAALYALLALANLAGALPGGLPGMTLSDPERGDRLYNYSAATAFAWFAWLSQARRQARPFYWAMLAVCGLAVVLTLSRVYMASVLLMSLLYLSGLGYRSISAICVIGFVLGTTQNMAGLLDESWNPYRAFAGDSSGNYRIMEYAVARDYILDHPVVGFGMAPNPAIAAILLNDENFAAGDLGPTGVWFDWGLAGLLLFLAGTAVAFRPRIARCRPHGAALFLTGCLLGLNGCVAPLIFTGGATLFSVLLALRLAERHAGLPTPSPLVRAATPNAVMAPAQ
ncbi:MAG: hypothetical protein JWQ88_2047 [Rhodoferax sp.]|nr:hypothetical protein [Rhodoferax sp.]